LVIGQRLTPDIGHAHERRDLVAVGEPEQMPNLVGHDTL
jgi:hypothetical protein